MVATTLTRPPVVSDATRREFIALLSATGFLAACGTDDRPSGDGSATRTAETPRGPVSIPVDPQRVVAVYGHDLDNALVLGLPVISGPGENGRANAPLAKYVTDAFPEQTADLTRTGYRPEVNIERLAALRPDVIFSGMFGVDLIDGQYDRFDAIAPTVTYKYSDGETYVINPWRDVLRLNGVQFGRDQAAEDWIAGYEQRAAALRQRVQARWAGASWAIIEPSTENFYTYGPAGGHVPDTLIDDLGLPPATGVAALLAEVGLGSQGGNEVSYERIAEVDADLVFVPVSPGEDGAPDRSGLDALSAQPLWASVPAVAAGQVYPITGDIVYESGVTATAFLDVVEATLLG